MNENTTIQFTWSNVETTAPASSRRPSSAGFPMPASAEQAPSSPAGCKSQSAKRSAADARSATDIAAILNEAKEEMREENRKAAQQTVRGGANKLGGCSSGSTLRMLFTLVNAFGDIVPFSGEQPSFRQEAKPEIADMAEAELDPRKWGACEDSLDLEDALSNLDEVLDPRNWGSDEKPASREMPASNTGRATDERGMLLNPTCIAARYEKEAEDARNGNWHHALNDISVPRYNQLIRASNDVATLWEGRVQATAYDLVKTLVFRTVIADDKLGMSVLTAAVGYLANTKRRAAPMIDLWHEEAGLIAHE